MKPSATGRIVFWRGGSLWIGRGGEPAGCHAHHAVQVSLPFPGQRVRLRRPDGRWTAYTAALVAADQPHAFDARGQQVAQIFVAPESQDGRRLQQRFRDSGIAALPPATVEPEVAALARAYAGGARDAELVELARHSIATLTGATAPPAAPPDARIVRAIDVIHEGLGSAITLRQVAAAVHLSPERFRHLFAEETGIGLRPYVLWLRLERALSAYVAGRTLTEAAHTGGFADSAHFSRTFKRMFGITPASVRPE